MRIEWNEFVISDDKALLDLDMIAGFLARSYWANNRSRERMEASIHNSLCYGIYLGERQVGFARVVTDFATMYYLCDVFIDEEFRGRSLGKKLIDTITSQKELNHITGMLGTRDAHTLYEQFGFQLEPERYMRRGADFVRHD